MLHTHTHTQGIVFRLTRKPSTLFVILLRCGIKLSLVLQGARLSLVFMVTMGTDSLTHGYKSEGI